MTILASDSARATAARVTDEAIVADLADGRTISVPIGWYPRLAHASPAERQNVQLIGHGQGIHWPDLDEDISVENLLLGKASGESNASFARWLAARTGSKTA